VKDYDLRDQVRVAEGVKLQLQNCTIHDYTTPAVHVDGKTVIQDCIIQNNRGHGVLVEPTGEITVTGTILCRCMMGLFVKGKTALGKTALLDHRVHGERHLRLERGRAGGRGDGGGRRRPGLQRQHHHQARAPRRLRRGARRHDHGRRGESGASIIMRPNRSKLILALNSSLLHRRRQHLPKEHRL